MKIGITGASGLIGTALSTSLLTSGHEAIPFVRATTKRPPATKAVSSADAISWDIENQTIDVDKVATLDAVVHLAGAGIADHRWTDSYRQTLVRSRIEGTTLLAQAIVDAGGPTTLISGSAIGFYGNRGDEVLSESATPGSGFLPDLCVAWEEATAPASAAGVRVATIRTGIVLSPKGGALAKMLPLFKFGLGGRFGDGKQWMSWIAIDDQVSAIEYLLTADVEGPCNLTAPSPVTNAEFARTLGRVLSRPSMIPVPRFGPRLALGRDLADSLLFESQRVVPDVLLTSGFDFQFGDLVSALEHIV